MTFTKLQKLGFIAIVFLFELLFYVFYSYSNMIIAVLPQDFEVRLLPYFFMNLTMFLSIFAIFLKFTGTKIFCRKTLAAAAAVLAVKCVSDVIFALIRPEEIYRYFICDIFHIVIILVILSAIAVIRRNEFKWNKNNTAFKISAALLILGIVCLLVSGIMLINYINSFYRKYDVEAVMFNNMLDLSFSGYMRGAAEIYGIIAVFARSIILIGSVKIINALFIPYKTDEVIDFKSTAVSGVCLILCLTLNLCFNTVGVFSGIGCKKMTSQKHKDHITIDFFQFNIARGTGENKYLNFITEKKYVYFGDTEICTFNTSPIAACGWFVDYGDEEKMSVVCQTEVIAYINENGKWETVKFKELGNVSEDPKLTEVLKNVCASGSLEVINYALPYFQKYEPNIIGELKEIVNNDQNESDSEVFLFDGEYYQKYGYTDSQNWILSEEYCEEIIEKINSL